MPLLKSNCDGLGELKELLSPYGGVVVRRLDRRFLVDTGEKISWWDDAHAEVFEDA